MVLLGMLLAPSLIAELFGLGIGAGGEFMTRRYGASGLVGLGIALWLSADRPAPSAVLGGLAGWFFVQGTVSVAGLMNGTVSSVAWLTVLADPGLGIGSLVLAVRLSRCLGATRLSRRTDGGKISVAPDGHLIHPVFGWAHDSFADGHLTHPETVSERTSNRPRSSTTHWRVAQR